MILCVTLNPCLDKTLTVPPWQPGSNIRGTATREVVGGKGNNVARALKRLGRLARPVTFLGGAVGTLCESMLRTDDGLEPLVVTTTAPTRTILTVRTGETAEQTAFFDPDPAVTSEEADRLLRLVEDRVEREPVEVLTLSGSSPSPSTHGLYSDLIASAKARRIPVFLDTYGPALAAIRGCLPDVIQLNRREAAAHLGRPEPVPDNEILRLLAAWSRREVGLCLVTDGADAVLANLNGRPYRAWPPRVEVVNPIGSGDSLLAGLVDAHLSRLDPPAILRRGIACASANAAVWDAGAVDAALVERLESSVKIEAL